MVRNRKPETAQLEPVVKENEEQHVFHEAPDWPSSLGLNFAEDTGKSLARRLFHWGPLITLILIFFIGSSASYLNLMWWPLADFYAYLHFFCFLFWNYSVLSNFLCAAFVGGGYLPKEWKPPKAEDEKRLQYCAECKGFKAPRVHHCSKCKRCVLKMDHHCPWINNCVGHRNHVFFVRFLVSAVIGCSHASVIIVMSIYHAIHLTWYTKFGVGTEPIVELTLYSLLLSVIAVAFSAAVAIAVGVLLFVQLKSIYRNQTALEEYIVMKAERDGRETSAPPFVFPYDLGWRENCRSVLFSKSSARGNGVWWPVKTSTHQFTLSEEQLRQKAAKRERARLVRVTRSYAGGCCRAITIGCRTFVCQPCSEEARVPVQKGELWLVTRGDKHWLYGKRHGEGDLLKGWFPRPLVELAEEDGEEERGQGEENGRDAEQRKREGGGDE